MSTLTTTRTVEEALPLDLSRRSDSLTRIALRRFLHDRLALAAGAVLLLLAIASAGAPLIAQHVTRYNPDRIELDKRFQPPSLQNWLGTDELGRDVLTRLLFGGQVSLSLGVIAGLVAVIWGGALGAIAGYFGGFADDVISALVSTLLSIPTLFLLILLAVTIKPTPLMIAAVIGGVTWMGVTRLVRGGVLAVRSRDYVDAARVIGATDARIISRHIVPNVTSTLIVVTYIDIATAILTESSLSYLGLGVQPPLSSWGNMLRQSMTYLFKDPWLLVPPGAVIFVTVLCLYIVGDALRDALDPRLKE